MTAEPALPNPDELLTLEEAAVALHVGMEQARAMVDQELLLPSTGTGDDALFAPAAVEAVRLAGG